MFDKEIQKFIDITLEHYAYTDIKNLSSPDYSTKKANSMVTKRNKLIQRIIATDEGIQEFLLLLDNPNCVIAATASWTMYPLEPKKCMNLMRYFYSTVRRDIGILMMLDGLEKKNETLIHQYEIIFGGKDRFETLSKIGH